MASSRSVPCLRSLAPCLGVLFLVFLAGTAAAPAQTAGAAPGERSRMEPIAPVPVAVPPGRKSRYRWKGKDAARDWVDTGVMLVPGDVVTLEASSSIALTDGHTVTADGMPHLWRDLLRQYPLPAAPTGAVIGRIGSSAAAVPFLIGSRLSLTVRSSGNLFVRCNLSPALTGEGETSLSVEFAKRPGAAEAKAVSPPLAAILQPSLLDALPRRDDDGRGNPGDAVNFALLGTEQQVRDAFARSGWFAVDADRDTALLHGLLSTLARQPYREVPMSTLYLFGRPQDMSFARGDTLRIAAERHHLRLWRTGQTVDGRPLWAGSATYDNGFERDSRTGALTHSIAPAIDEERDFLRDSFLASGSCRSAAYFTPTGAIRQGETATGGAFHTDGRLLLVDLED